MAKNKKQDHGAQIAMLHHGLERSHHWPTVEKHFKAENPTCAVCGSKKNIQIHHRNPFHYVCSLGRPDLEIDKRNLISLCEQTNKDHHLLIGHAGDFHSSNLDVAKDVKKFDGMNKKEILETKLYKLRLKNRLKPLHKMSQVEQKAYRKQLDNEFSVDPEVETIVKMENSKLSRQSIKSHICGKSKKRKPPSVVKKGHPY